MPDANPTSSTQLQSDEISHGADSDGSGDEHQELIYTVPQQDDDSSIQPINSVPVNHVPRLVRLSLVLLALVLIGALLYQRVIRSPQQSGELNRSPSLPAYLCTPAGFDHGSWIQCSHVDVLANFSGLSWTSDELQHTRMEIMRLTHFTAVELETYARYLAVQCEKMRDNNQHVAWPENVPYQLYHPQGCSPYHISRTEVLDCLQDTRLLMVGDSTTQELALDLVAMLENQTTAYVLEPWKLWPCSGKPDNYDIRIISTATFPSPVLSAHNISIDYLFNGNLNHCNNGGPPEQQLMTPFQLKLDDISRKCYLPSTNVSKWHRAQYDTYRMSHPGEAWMSYARNWHLSQHALERSSWQNSCCKFGANQSCDKWSDADAFMPVQADVSPPPHDWLLYTGPGLHAADMSKPVSEEFYNSWRQVYHSLLPEQLKLARYVTWKDVNGESTRWTGMQQMNQGIRQLFADLNLGGRTDGLTRPTAAFARLSLSNEVNSQLLQTSRAALLGTQMALSSLPKRDPRHCSYKSDGNPTSGDIRTPWCRDIANHATHQFCATRGLTQRKRP